MEVVQQDQDTTAKSGAHGEPDLADDGDEFEAQEARMVRFSTATGLMSFRIEAFD
jgi:hypothetical protein